MLGSLRNETFRKSNADEKGQHACHNGPCLYLDFFLLVRPVIVSTVRGGAKRCCQMCAFREVRMNKYAVVDEFRCPCPVDRIYQIHVGKPVCFTCFTSKVLQLKHGPNNIDKQNVQLFLADRRLAFASTVHSFNVLCVVRGTANVECASRINEPGCLKSKEKQKPTAHSSALESTRP